MKIRNKGFSLLELILVLGAIFILVAGAFLLYKKVEENVRVKNESQFVNKLKVDVINFYDNQTTYEQISSKTLIAYNLIDSQNIQGDTIKDSLGTSFDANSYNGGTGFSFIIKGISQSSCMKLLPYVSSSFSQINEKTSSNIKPENYGDICQDGTLTLTYSDIIKKSFNTGIGMNGINVETFPDKFNRDNTLSIAGNDFNMKITESNQGDSLVNYISKELGISDQIKTNTSSTGYTNSTCGAFSNSSTCGNISVDKILGAILSAPDSVKEGAKLTMGTNVSKENVNAICSTFSCSTQLNSNGYPEIVVDIK